MTSLASRMLCHAYDPTILNPLSRTEQFGKNLALKTLYNMESMLCTRRHTCLPRSARLKFSKSLNPNPPWLFGWQNFFQAIQCIFLEFPEYPHQNFQTKDSISLHRLLGNLKHPIVKVSIAWITNLITISRLAWDKSFSFHPCILCQTLSLL